MEKNTKNAFRFQSATVLTGILLIHVLIAALLVFPGTGEVLPENTWLNDYEVRGMTVDEALEDLLVRAPEAFDIQLVDQQGALIAEKTLSLEAIEVGYPEAAIRRTLKEVLNPEWREHWTNRIRGISPAHHFHFSPEYNEEILSEWVHHLASEIQQESQDARVWVENGTVYKKTEQEGRQLPVDALMEIVETALTAGMDGPLVYQVAIEPPLVTLADIGSFDQKLMEYRTHLGSNESRRENIRLAGEKVNGTRVPEQGLFSFNKTVGKATSEEGYLRAPVIANGRLGMGIGGGICQVTSTLYQTVLRSGFEIVERRNHSLPVGYLPLGMDAVISHGTLDFQFANPYGFPVLLGVWIESDHLYTAVFGPEDFTLPKIEIETRNHRITEPKVILIEDPTLKMGVEVVQQAGKAGRELQVYRLTGSDEDSFKEELISTDRYQPVNHILRVGTGEDTEDHK